MTVSTPLLIGGEEREGGEGTFPVPDPARDGAVAGYAAAASAADTEHAMTIAGQLRTGVTFFNNHNAAAVDERAPFGGFNASGIGREIGRPGMAEFTQTHVMAVPFGG
jgi:acyl-CoA reductase-like NAD-dependent aldehyde dehydrogenase